MLTRKSVARMFISFSLDRFLCCLRASRVSVRTLHSSLCAGRREQTHGSNHKVLEHTVRDLGALGLVFCETGDLVGVIFLEGRIEAAARSCGVGLCSSLGD